MAHEDDHTVPEAARIREAPLDERRPDAHTLPRRQDGHGSQCECLVGCGTASHSYATEEDVADDAIVFDRDQA